MSTAKAPTVWAPAKIEWLLRGRPGSPITVVVQTPGDPRPRTVTFNRMDWRSPPAAAQSSSASGRGGAGGGSAQPARTTPAPATAR